MTLSRATWLAAILVTGTLAGASCGGDDGGGSGGGGSSLYGGGGGGGDGGGGSGSGSRLELTADPSAP